MDVFDQQGKRINLGQEVGRGGEATVYRAGNRSGLLAKIYTPAPRPNYPDKLDWMIHHPPENPTRAQSHPSLAWPTGLLYDSPSKNRRMTGFLMPHIQGAVPILEVLNPRRRRIILPRFNRRYLLRTARNMAAALSALHRCGYVAGDLNESNVLVTPSALITMIDADSFQVIQRRNSRPVIYPCPVGKLEYTAPEMQGQPLDKVYRKPEHDSFSLAVLIFQLLVEGNHPFRAQWLGSGEPPPIEERIKMGAFPHTASPGKLVRPPKGSPDINLLHPGVTELFRRCFIDGHEEPKFRPDASTWERALTTAESALVVCSSGHLFSNHLTGCPYCPPSSRRAAPQPVSTNRERQAPPDRRAADSRPRPAAPQQTAAGPGPRPQPARSRQNQPQVAPWSWSGSSGPVIPSWIQSQVQQWFQNWIQTRVNVYGAPVFTPQPSQQPSTRPAAAQPAAVSQPVSSQPAVQQAPSATVTARPPVSPARHRRTPWRVRGKPVLPMLRESLVFGAGSGALVGLVPGLLSALAAFFLLSSEPAWAFLWAFGGAAGAGLRGIKIGQRLGLVIAQHIGWKRFWQGAGLLIGAAVGGLLSLPFALAIFPIFIGVITGARLGLETGNRIWSAGNRLGWERTWMITGGVASALLGAAVAYSGAALLGSPTSALTQYLTTYLTSLQLAPVWPALASGALGSLWGGAFSGLLIDFGARFTNLID